MAAAEVGDDVFGEDPTVNRLQERVAGLLGKEAALYVPSGTMGNQLCIKVHTQPGRRGHRRARIARVQLRDRRVRHSSPSVQVHTVEGQRGVLGIEEVRQAIRPKLYYMPRTRLICLENTHNRAGGTIYPLESIAALSAFARGRRV